MRDQDAAEDAAGRPFRSCIGFCPHHSFSVTFFTPGFHLVRCLDLVSRLLLSPVYVAFPFPLVISSWNLGRKKLMSENRDMTLSRRGGRG